MGEDGPLANHRFAPVRTPRAQARGRQSIRESAGENVVVGAVMGYPVSA